MRSKLVKTHKTYKDYTARNMGIGAVLLTAIAFCVMLPASNYIEKENVALNQEIEVLVNDNATNNEIAEDSDETPISKTLSSRIITYKK
ncbi:MAG: hypothetical protein HUJ61_00660 [Bacilli bacterium]|nr:hypothetical protein [Bacilli bacterium]